jgi:hypothetical protein
MAKKRVSKKAALRKSLLQPTGHKVVTNHFYVQKDQAGPIPEDPPGPPGTLEEVIRRHVAKGQR